jgi:hypothetical protein
MLLRMSIKLVAELLGSAELVHTKLSPLIISNAINQYLRCDWHWTR